MNYIKDKWLNHDVRWRYDHEYHQYVGYVDSLFHGEIGIAGNTHQELYDDCAAALEVYYNRFKSRD